jgi:hypothetical protein
MPTFQRRRKYSTSASSGMTKPKRAEFRLKLEDEQAFLESTGGCLPVSGVNRDFGGGH